MLRAAENIQLEATYSGKAFKVILFWNTFCSGAFQDKTNIIDYHDLPVEVHHYFEEDLDVLDQGV